MALHQIDQAIRVHDKLLLAPSKASMASDWVQHEVIQAVEREKAEKRQVLFPISLVSFKASQEWTAFDSTSRTLLGRPGQAFPGGRIGPIRPRVGPGRG